MIGKHYRWEVQESDSTTILSAFLISDSAFLAFHVIRELLNKGAEIYFLKNYSGPDGEIKELKGSPRFHFCGKNLPSDFDYVFQINAVCQKPKTFSPLQSLKLAHSKGAKFLLATVFDKDYPRSFFLNFDKRAEVDWRLVHFNFVYGPSWETNSALEELFSQVEKARVLIAGIGGEKAYPLYIDDFVQGLLRAMFSHDSKKKLYVLTGLEQITLLDFAWRTKRVVGKDLEVVHVAPQFTNTWTPDSALLEKIKKSWWRLVFKPKINFDEGIKLTLSGIFKQNIGIGEKIIQSLVPNLPKITIPKLTMKPSNILPLAFLCLTCLFIIFAPFLAFASFGLIGFVKLQNVEEKIASGEFASLSTKIVSAKGNFQTCQKILRQFSPVVSFAGLGDKGEKVEDFLGLAIDLAQSLESVDRAYNKAKNLGEIVFQNKVGDPGKELEDLAVELGQIEEQLAFAQVKVDKLYNLTLPFGKDFNNKVKQLNDELPSLRYKISSAHRLLSLASPFLAFEDKKTYLLLLQNNMELRATGGFIGSYALMTFEKGRLLDLFVEDVYSADGQLKGHVEPPQALKKYLGSTNWYLRDSNWSPDFPTTATQAEWFLQKETGQAVDGVIAVNLDFVKSLLEVVGPVQLPEYKEKITATNLFERAEYHAEVDFFPGSTGKKSFLTSLSSFLFERLKDLPAPSCLDFFYLLEKNLEEKDVMLFFHNSQLEQKIRSLGWGGEIRKMSFAKNSQFQGPGLIDYLMVVDTNVGVNKANYFLTRQLNFEATILKEGEIINKVTLVYHNTSPSASWPGGTYKNYLRILVPDDVEEVSVKQAWQDQKDFKIMPSSQIEKEEEFGKRIFGFLLEVPPAESRTVVVTYNRQEKLPLEQFVLDYAFYLAKQSGTKDDPVTLKVNFPAFLKPVKLMPKGEWKPQNVSFQTQLDKDKLFAIEFSH